MLVFPMKPFLVSNVYSANYLQTHMGPLLWIFICIITGVISGIWIAHTSFKSRIAPAILLALAVHGFFGACFTWSEAAGKENLKYHYQGTIAFEYNPSDRQYYIHHDGKFINALDDVYGFDPSLLNQPEYDSCYVYLIETPVFMGFLSNHNWHNKYTYRQGRDILLEHRTVDKVEINEGKD